MQLGLGDAGAADAKDDESARDSRSRLRFWRRDEGEGDDGDAGDK